MTAKKARHYINNKDFLAALIEYQKRCDACETEGKPLPQIPEYIGLCIDLICKRLSLKSNFIRYTYREELIGNGTIHCCAAVNNFNPNVSKNPFAYFTTIAYNAFLRTIEVESGQNYAKHKNLEDLFIMSEEFYGELGSNRMNEDGKISGDTEGLQRHYDVIRNFEAKLARKKEKTRQAALNKSKSDLTKKKKALPKKSKKTRAAKSG